MHIAGICPMDSWEYTWGEGCEAVNAYNLRENDRAKKQAVALYNAAVFLVRTITTGGDVQSFYEAFPGFGPEEKKEQKDMTDEAMYAVVRALNAQFGGKEGE